MRKTEDWRVKGQHAHDFLIYFDMLTSKNWVDSANRFLIRDEIFMGANIQHWERQAHVAVDEWNRLDYERSKKKTIVDKKELERINRQAREAFSE